MKSIHGPDRTRNTGDILDLQRLQKKRDGLNPELQKKADTIVDAIYIRDADLDIDILEKKHKVLCDYFFQSARQKGYQFHKPPHQYIPYVSLMVLTPEAKKDRIISNLKDTIVQKDREIASLKKELE